MTTVIIHGTLANGASWYQNSWQNEGFLAGLNLGMMSGNDTEDIWSLNGAHVTEYNELGVYGWSGSLTGILRGQAATELALYLNAITQITDEPIRVIAHSHGCNVFKLASSSPQLAHNVFVEQVVFLACPHFSEDTYEPEKLSFMDSLNIAKVYQAGKQNKGSRYRYPLNPDKVGRVLNIYTEQDNVQAELAQKFGGTQPPMSGKFWDDFKMLMDGGLTEMPISSRWETDTRVTHLYENIALQIDGECGGIQAHSVMHGYAVGQLCGVWLNSGWHIDEIIQQYGAPTLNPTDVGD